MFIGCKALSNFLLSHLNQFPSLFMPGRLTTKAAEQRRMQAAHACPNTHTRAHMHTAPCGAWALDCARKAPRGTRDQVTDSKPWAGNPCHLGPPRGSWDGLALLVDTRIWFLKMQRTMSSPSCWRIGSQLSTSAARPGARTRRITLSVCSSASGSLKFEPRFKHFQAHRFSSLRPNS